MVLEKGCMLSKYVFNLKRDIPGKKKLNQNRITTNLAQKEGKIKGSEFHGRCITLRLINFAENIWQNLKIDIHFQNTIDGKLF